MVDYMLNALSSDSRFHLFGQPGGGYEKIPLFSFSVEHLHHEDLALILDKMGVAVRSGQMCAEPLMDRFGVTGMLSMNAYPSRNGKCRGDFMSCIVMNAVRNTNEKFTTSPRNGSISETKAPMPMARVNAIRLARFDRGLTERSLPSIIRAMMTTNTPTSALFWPNTAVYTPTKRHSARKNRLFPINVLAFMIPAPGGAISRCHIPG